MAERNRMKRKREDNDSRNKAGVFYERYSLDFNTRLLDVGQRSGSLHFWQLIAMKEKHSVS